MTDRADRDAGAAQDVTASRDDIRVYVARKILTMNPAQPVATHVAVRDGRILAVGGLQEMRRWTDAAPI